MADLADLSHLIGQDLFLSPVGDLGTVTQVLRSEQRVLRRLLTNPGDYIWHPEYGAGLPQMIGQPVSVATITALILAQIALEPSVAQTPSPVINVTANGNSVVQVDIQYTVLGTGQTTVLNVPITG